MPRDTLPPPTAPAESVGRDWFGLATLSRLTGLSEPTIKRFARDGRIGVRRVPGTHPRYSWQDACKLIETATRPASA